MDSYTVLFIPDHNAKVRRFHVPGRRVRRVLWGSAIGSLLLALGSVDYVRVRIDSFELASLRAETAEQRERLQLLARSVSELEGRLTRVRELERKVRVIADLPAPAERTVTPAGQGGGAGDEDFLSEGEAAPELPEVEGPPPRPTSDSQAPEPPQASLEASPRAARAASLQLHAQQLARLAEQREASLAALVEQLKGKQQRLASTPSIWPTEGWVTSGYGYRTSPFTGRRQFHGGVDIAGRPGTAVVAPARGRVLFAGKQGPLGLTVILDHGYGVRTAYGHNQALFVQKGEEVIRGQRVAALGSSGRSTGPHVHYAVQVDGRRVNPMTYILDE